MKKVLTILLFITIPIVAVAATEELPIRLEHVRVNIHDKASILRGAKFYAQNCMVCHSMRYLQHNAIAKEAGITLDKMPLKNKEWYLGIVPPDLTLTARVHSADWLYSYFHAFYKDEKRPTGFNNLLMKDVNMTNVFLPYQGEQILKPLHQQQHAGANLGKPRYFGLLVLVKQGSMTQEQFDATMTDLINFLVYASDPGKIQREKIGIWVLVFLAVLGVLAYFLKNVFWKDVE